MSVASPMLPPPAIKWHLSKDESLTMYFGFAEKKPLVSRTACTLQRSVPPTAAIISTHLRSLLLLLPSSPSPFSCAALSPTSICPSTVLL